MEEMENEHSAWRLRLEIVKEEVTKCLVEYKQQASEGSHSKLKILNDRFIKETHAAMAQLNQTEVSEYTKLQLEVDLLSDSTFVTPTRCIQSKLPKLELPKFRGDLLRWTEFWDRFQASVDSQHLCNADKLSYLQASLEDSALKAIDGLQLNNENYIVAVDILKNKYGKPGAVLDAHYTALYNLKPASSSHKDCMDAFNEIERHLRVLKALGEDVNHNQFRSLIIGKLPERIIHELRSRTKVDEETVDVIRAQLDHLLAAWIPTEESQPCSTIDALHVQTQREPKRRFMKRKHSRAQGEQCLLAPERKKMKMKPCIFCEGSHYNDQCLKPIKERKAVLRNRCFKCFGNDHSAKDCRRNKKCFHCKSMQHNSAICMMPRRGNNTATRILHSRTNITTTLLQTAIVFVRNGLSNTIKLRALFDTGSQRSYITTKAAHTLGADLLDDNRLMVYTFGSNTPKEVLSPLIEVEIVTECPIKITLNVMPYITKDIECASLQMSTELSRRIQGNLADDGSLGTTIDLLIGNDYYHTFISGEKIKYEERLYLVKSCFGWIWSGIQEDTNSDATLSVITYIQDGPILMTSPLPDPPLRDSHVHKIWDLETIGILDSPKATRDDQAVEEFNRTVKFHNNRYWIKWPWCQAPSNLPNNFGLAYGRLNGLIKRMDKETLEKYDAIIKDQLKKGILEEIDENIPIQTTVHYLPHHGVKKGSKLRLVYDASSKTKNVNSLNECLYKGPLLLENLVKLIIRFRKYRFGVTADIEGAFLQIGIQEEDRDVTRSLWLKNIKENPTEENLKHLRFCRVPFGIVCSPFLLAITVKHHLQNRSTLCKDMIQDIYVDNLITGGDSTEQCYSLYKETKLAFNEISMNMRDWRSNNKDLIQQISEGPTGRDTLVNILGLVWCTQKDTLSLKPNANHCMTQANTKRQVLKCIASIFDPCGFACPLLLRSKLFLQKLWQMRLDWDSILCEDLQKEWIEIAADLYKTKLINIPRWYGIDLINEKSTELHCFADASKDAAAAVIYLKVDRRDGSRINFVMSRSRMTPIKNREAHTIPRLELMAIWIGCRLLKHVADAINIGANKLYVWSDSQVALHWLASKRVLPPYVGNRIQEIKKINITEFRYVPTKDNPADIATRPCQDLEQSCWLEGPHFLKERTKWPEQAEAVQCLLNQMEDGELEKLKQLQLKYFPDEMKGKVTNLSRSLGLYKDNGILRCSGRFKHTDWPAGQKYPILLPKNDDFTFVVIEETHKRMYHVGTSHTLAAVRQRFWVPHGRAQVQKVIHRCKECRKYGGGPYKAPIIAPLPKERVTMSKPFTFTGIDYLGPLYVKTDKDDIGKRWVCIYTCLAIRAIHLEVVSNLSAEECLLAMRRFIATRGAPFSVLSDNAANFKLTAEVLTGDYCIKNKIKWKFIPELAPWFGGVYERLVALVKHCMKRTIDKHVLNNNQLTTVIKEIEAILNCRPLTTVGQDLEHILTPGDFLCLGGPLSLDEVDEDNILITDSETKRNLIEKWKRGQIVLNEFKKMFLNQYLPMLRERYTLLKEPRKTHNSKPQVGDIVQLKDDAPRVKWKVGKIMELYEGKDKEIRTAKIKVGDKDYTRAIIHLYPLEVQEENNPKTSKALSKSNNEMEGFQEELAEGEFEYDDKNGRERKIPDRDINTTEIKEKESDITNKGTNRGRKAAMEARKKMKEWLKVLCVRD